MKKVSLFVVLTGIMFSMSADMIYDPTTGKIYPKPGKGINQNEYYLCALACVQLEKNIQSANPGRVIKEKEYRNQFIAMLKRIGTPAARQLIADVKKNAVYYPNGQFMRKIY